MDKCITNIGVTCVYYGHVFYTQPISQFNGLCNELTYFTIQRPV